MAERIDKRGQPYLRFACECGQKQESPEPDGGAVRCARCGKEHTPDG